MPWHISGPEHLTWDEIDAYAADAKRRADANRKAASRTKRKR